VALVGGGKEVLEKGLSLSWTVCELLEEIVW